jgi:hypothetical protein
MLQSEAEGLVAAVAAAFPWAKFDEETVDLWARRLLPFDLEVGVRAVDRFIDNEERPSVGRLTGPGGYCYRERDRRALENPQPALPRASLPELRREREELEARPMKGLALLAKQAALAGLDQQIARAEENGKEHGTHG